MSIFDGARNLIHDTTTAVFGESCVWIPSAGGPSQTNRVNFQQPDEEDTLGDYQGTQYEFLAWNTRMEYRSPQFPTLKASVDSGTAEYVTINGTEYLVTKVSRQHDGATFWAKLEVA